MDLKKLFVPEAQYNVWRKVFVLAGVVGFYTIGYMYLNSTTINSERFYDVSFEFEKNIPFYYQLVWSYIFVYFLVIVMFLTINSDALLNEAIKTFIVCMGIHFLFFYFMPVKMVDRPVLVPNGNLWHDYAAFWYWVDQPTTLFPSAHVSMSLLSALYTRRVNRRLGDFCLVIALYVAISVVLIKQHYVADVFAGFILASSTYLFFSRGYEKKIWTRIPGMQISQSEKRSS